MSKLQGNSSFKNSIRNMQLEKFKKTTIAGIPIKQSTETLEDYIYTKKGLKDSTLVNGNKYIITGFFQISKLKSHLRLVNTNSKNKVIYDDSSISVILSADKSYIYVEGKLSNNTLKYKFYFNNDEWKQIVVENETEVEKNISKFNELSYFYDATKCDDVYILALLSGLDGVDYEEINVTLKDALNNLSEFNYGYNNTGYKYGNTYMLPKYFPVTVFENLFDDDTSSSSVDPLTTIMSTFSTDGGMSIYEQNKYVQKKFITLTNGKEYVLPKTITDEDKEYISSKVNDFAEAYMRFADYDYDNGERLEIDDLPTLFLNYIDVDSLLGFELKAALPSMIINAGPIETLNGIIYSNSSNISSSISVDTFRAYSGLDYDSTNDEYSLAYICFEKDSYDKNSSNTLTTIYDFTDASASVPTELKIVKYNLSLIDSIVSMTNSYIQTLDPENDADIISDYTEQITKINNLRNISDQILTRLLNSGAQENVSDYKFGLTADLSNLVSLIQAMNSTSGSSGRLPGSTTNLFSELQILSLFKLRIYSESRNINLFYNIGNLTWYDTNGNVIDPKTQDLKFVLGENDYIIPKMQDLLLLNPYNEFEKEPIKMTTLKDAYYDEYTSSTVPNFALMQISDDLEDITVETDSFNTIKSAVHSFLNYTESEGNNNEESNDAPGETVIDSITQNSWTQTTKNGLSVYQSNSIGNNGSTSIDFTVSGIGNAVVHIMSDAEGWTYDYCYVLVDNEKVLSTEYDSNVSGEYNGSQPNQNIWFHYPIYINDNNIHNITVIYTKDSSAVEGEDCAWCYVTVNDAGNYNYENSGSTNINIAAAELYSYGIKSILINSESFATKFINFLNDNNDIKDKIFNEIYFETLTNDDYVSL